MASVSRLLFVSPLVERVQLAPPFVLLTRPPPVGR
jgi:hypothetical protein